MARVHELLGGPGGRLFVEGAAGMGKSDLLAASERLARRSGVIALSGRASRLAAAIPLAPLLSALGQGFPAPPAAAGPDRFWFVTTMARVLADAGPTVILLDDMHLADELTAAALGTLIPALAGSTVSWIIGYRLPAPDAPWRSTLDHLSAATFDPIVLRLLPPAGVDQLCADITGAPPDRELRTWLHGAAGNPFLIRTLVRALANEGRIVTHRGAAAVVGKGMPAGFVAAIDQWTRRLSPDAVTLLHIAAVIARPFILPDAASLAGRPTAHLIAAAQETLRDGILAAHGDRLAFRSRLLAGAIRAAVPAPTRHVLDPPVRRPPEPRACGPVAGVLSTSELQVARLVVEGLTNREVAARLSVSPHTVDTYLRRAFTKLGISRRVQLAGKMLSPTR